LTSYRQVVKVGRMTVQDMPLLVMGKKLVLDQNHTDAN